MKLAPQQGWPHVMAAEWLAKHALPILEQLRPDVVFGYDTALLPLASALRERERPLLVLEQCIAPRKSQSELADRLDPFLPKREMQMMRLRLAHHSAIEQQEWVMADFIVCPSPFVAEELVRFGCARNKITVIPYGFTPKEKLVRRATRPARPLRVLFVGTVSYRKGIHDLYSLASRLGRAVVFTALGSISVDKTRVAEWSNLIHFRGPVGFSEVVAALKSTDLVILPSYFEGSATVIYEAMAYGLPCVVTRQTGSVITSGKDGVIVEAGDVDAMEAAVRSFLEDPLRLEQLGAAALSTAQEYTAEKYGKRLTAFVEDTVEASSSSTRTKGGSLGAYEARAQGAVERT